MPRPVSGIKTTKSIKREIWEQGIALQSEQLTIQMEQNPFEILKLGTYVGSCLGLGGGFSYSAVAALLDVNKQVLYARNHRGVVVARQLDSSLRSERPAGGASSHCSGNGGGWLSQATSGTVATRTTIT